MKFPVHTHCDYTVIALSGEIDIKYSPTAREQILEHLENGENLLIDMTQVEYIDSSGVANLVEGLRIARHKDLKFALISVSEPAMQVLRLARLDKVLPIHDSASDSL
ncbi:MAG: STAS domain-containing protein [Gammaproteobacteria bacterium]